MALIVTLTEEVQEGLFKATGEVSSGEVKGEAEVLVEVQKRTGFLVVNDDAAPSFINGVQVKEYNRNKEEKPKATSSKNIAVGTELTFSNFSFTHKK